MNNINEEKLENVSGGKVLENKDGLFTPILEELGKADVIMGRSYKFRCCDCNEIFYRSAGDPETCKKCGSTNIARCP